MNAHDLKNSILQLAIQGKLVEQRKEEGTAKELIEEIKAEKERLIKEKKIKKEKPLPEITEDEVPFEIPESWEWVRLNNILNFIDYRGKTPNKINNGIILVTASNVRKGFLDFTKEDFISESEFYERMSRGITQKGDILFTTEAPLGNVAINTIEVASCGQRVITFQQYGKWQFYNELICLFIQSPLFQQELLNNATGTTAKGIKAAKLKTILLPFPPLAEQKRIVAKIEELIPYIEKYGTAHSKLEEFNKKFPEDMQKSILQYAIQGKLVEQREEEGTAEELYKKIQEEKEKLIKEKKIKKEKPLAEITDDEVPFEIPESWKWVRLRDLVSFCGGFAYKSTSYVDESNNQIIRLGNVKNDNIVLETNPVFISDELAANTNKYEILADDILFTMTGTRGKKDYFYTTVVGEDVLKIKKLYLNQRVGCLRNLYNINMQWLSLFLKADCITTQIFATETGTANQGNIGSDNTMALLIPLPPLSEQKRIVAKIEEMLPYCQQLVK